MNTDYSSMSDYIPIRDSSGNLLYDKLYFSFVPGGYRHCVFYDVDKTFVTYLSTQNDIKNWMVDLSERTTSYYIKIIKYPSYNDNLIVLDRPFKNQKFLEITNENLSNDIQQNIKEFESGTNLIDLTTFTKNKFIDTNGNIIDNDKCDLSELIQIRNTDGTLKYESIFFSKARTNAANCIFYDENQEFISYTSPENGESENWEIDLKSKIHVFYIRIAWFHEITDLKVTDKFQRNLSWLKIDESNLDDEIKSKLNSSYNERPENGEVHFTVDVERTINGIKDTYEDDCILFLPENYSSKKIRMVISCHGSGTVINENFHIATKSWNKFLYEMGFAILDVNGGVSDGRHYGASFAIQSYYRAYNYVIKNYNICPDVFLLGASMGGLSSFSLVENTQIPVLAQADFCGVVDHYKSAWCKPWWSGGINDFSTQRKSIAQYFNFSNYDNFQGWTTAQIPSSEEKQFYLANQEKIVGYNPILKNSINNDNIYTSDNENVEYSKMYKIHKVPLKIWHCKDDTTVSYNYSQYLYNAIKRAGGVVEIKLYETGGHTPGWGGKETITNYNNQQVEGYNNEIECYEWFKKFE